MLPLPLLDMPAVSAGEDIPIGASCISCGLFRNVLSPKMPPFGENRRGLMTVGEGPGEREDRVGKPWQGQTGQLLRRALGRLGVDLDRDCVSTNAVACRPEGNRTPTPHEAMCCRVRFLRPAIKRTRPRVVLLLGGAATASVVGSLLPEVSDQITKWRGFRIPVPEWGCWLCPTFHPSFVAGSADRPEVETIWERDLEAAVDQLREPVPKPEDLRRRITILRSDEDVLAALSRVRPGLFSHDYETTGLHPSLHELVSAAFSTSPDRAFAFEWTGSSRVEEAWRNILSDDRVGKVAHNIKFENAWGTDKLGVEDITWAHDSMIAAHVLDNRPGICGLKLQLFLNLGIPDYGSAIAPFLESSDPKDLAAPNRIREFIERYGWEEELIYNGIDSLGGLRLSLRQIDLLKRGHNR